jgi:hypothetical protein
MKIPVRYVPTKITEKDKQKQVKMLIKSRKLYKQHKYYTRPKIASYKSITSKHILNARKIYNIQNVKPNKELALKTGCTLESLKEIVKKGEGAYFSSGSRPNQSAHSWAFSRLSSSLTGGKSASVNFNILDKGCNHKKKAFILANKSRKKYKYGQSKTRKVDV